MPADDRIKLTPLGEVYEDLLTLDAAINGRSAGVQATVLLYAKLQEREPRIKERIQYLADKRRISFEECRQQLLTGAFKKISPSEYLKVLEQQEQDVIAEEEANK